MKISMARKMIMSTAMMMAPTFHLKTSGYFLLSERSMEECSSSSTLTD